MEFLWYLKNISLAALGGYAAGIAAYLGTRVNLLDSFFPAAASAVDNLPPLPF